MFQKIPVVPLPAAGVAPAGALQVKCSNVLSILGTCASGKGKLYLLRRVQFGQGASDFQYRVWKTDRPIAVDAAVAGGQFSAQYELPQACGPEYFALYTPDALTFTGDVLADGETLR